MGNDKKDPIILEQFRADGRYYDSEEEAIIGGVLNHNYAFVQNYYSFMPESTKNKIISEVYFKLKDIAAKIHDDDSTENGSVIFILLKSNLASCNKNGIIDLNEKGYQLIEYLEEYFKCKRITDAKD